MRLTADVIGEAATFINTVKDRELDLRGLNIPAIENLGATKDLNDTLDLTDNDIRQITNFPYLPRLKHLFLSNNRISRIDAQAAKYLPNLLTLMLTNNQINELGDLESLSAFKNLQYLSLLDNPVTKKKHYRLWTISKLPKLRVFDFRKVKAAERKEALELFGQEGKETTLAKELNDTKSKTFEPTVEEPKSNLPTMGLTPQEQQRIRDSIKQAKSLDEITMLEKMLQSGQIPEAQKQRLGL
ncbi:hypothetical protein BZG36_01128 [Bifiguratus adelaidae]|uniref:U2 small nuclear ribonucleoprotein A' n=1 Tax=Bifiguratus adelaidae TaxID=1938954 RepID=A0A261Y5X7_9FUNG|nr:hypothetical protein BZG36_01128 [Bifiguratus adelaidae]